MITKKEIKEKIGDLNQRIEDMKSSPTYHSHEQEIEKQIDSIRSQIKVLKWVLNK